MTAWSLAELAAVPHSVAYLSTTQASAKTLSASSLRAAWRAGQRLLARVDGQKPELLVAEGSVANAFAFYHQGLPHIAVNVAMVELLGDDESTWAALIGHELAHFNLRHSDVRSHRQTTGQATSGLLGIVLALAGVPFGGALADTATTVVERGYSRDDERAADRAGVEYMLQAGYDPDGAIRLQQRLAAANGGQALPFLSTHPGGSERIEAMRALVRTLAVEVGALAE